MADKPLQIMVPEELHRALKLEAIAQGVTLKALCAAKLGVPLPVVGPAQAERQAQATDAARVAWVKARPSAPPFDAPKAVLGKFRADLAEWRKAEPK